MGIDLGSGPDCFLFHPYLALYSVRLPRYFLIVFGHRCRSCSWEPCWLPASAPLPAKTFFKYESAPFRRSFLAKHKLWSVANFANLADTLFAGRATLPAAVIFFTAAISSSDDAIETFSPLVANQPTSAPSKTTRRQDVWSIS